MGTYKNVKTHFWKNGKALCKCKSKKLAKNEIYVSCEKCIEILQNDNWKLLD